MDQRLLWLAVLMATARAAQITKKNYSGYKLIQVVPVTSQQISFLQELEQHEEVDFWTPPLMSHPVTFLVAPSVCRGLTRKLEQIGLNVTITNENIQAAMDQEESSNERTRSRLRTRSQMTITNTFPRCDDLNVWLTQQAATHHQIAEILDIGQTYEGRTMRVIKIGKPHFSGRPKPAAMLDSGIHAREWITVGTMVYIIERLLNDYYTDHEVQRLVNTFDFYILPVANPDGYEYTHTADRLWRKTRSRTQGFSYSAMFDCRGVDPNRNFGFHWGGSGTSPNPCYSTYRGQKPFSEKCTQNMRDFILSKSDVLKLYFSLHSFSQLWLTPWAYDDLRPDDYDELERVARIGAAAIHSVNGRTFQIGNPASILYSASGGSYDWAKGVANIKYSYVLELFPDSGARNGFVVQTSDIEDSGREIWAALKAVVYAIYEFGK